ncbi:unnamed protein product [Cyprideis torosa]|uniref:Uncharacterized protein n=1 Tax=Cyprideis torosa TaxID=163714 RepID=A0A7R8W501_9CRUS|nr:unnamed protein product [Cyprideis torosa]CAG0879325.1 unnamed protein product [Cyprideis torosa]
MMSNEEWCCWVSPLGGTSSPGCVSESFSTPLTNHAWSPYENYILNDSAIPATTTETEAPAEFSYVMELGGTVHPQSATTEGEYPNFATLRLAETCQEPVAEAENDADVEYHYENLYVPLPHQQETACIASSTDIVEAERDVDYRIERRVPRSVPVELVDPGKQLFPHHEANSNIKNELPSPTWTASPSSASSVSSGVTCDEACVRARFDTYPKAVANPLCPADYDGSVVRYISQSERTAQCCKQEVSESPHPDDGEFKDLESIARFKNMSVDELTCLLMQTPIKEINARIKSGEFPAGSQKILKRERRKFKNRGYAQKSREKKSKEKVALVSLVYGQPNLKHEFTRQQEELIAKERENFQNKLKASDWKTEEEDKLKDTMPGKQCGRSVLRQPGPTPEFCSTLPPEKHI